MTTTTTIADCCVSHAIHVAARPAPDATGKLRPPKTKAHYRPMPMPTSHYTQVNPLRLHYLAADNTDPNPPNSRPARP